MDSVLGARPAVLGAGEEQTLSSPLPSNPESSLCRDGNPWDLRDQELRLLWPTTMLIQTIKTSYSDGRKARPVAKLAMSGHKILIK